MGQLSGIQQRQILSPPSTARQTKEIPLRLAYLRAASWAVPHSLSPGMNIDCPTSIRSKPYLLRAARSGTGMPVSMGNGAVTFDIPSMSVTCPDICPENMEIATHDGHSKRDKMPLKNRVVGQTGFVPVRTKAGQKAGQTKWRISAVFITGTNCRDKYRGKAGEGGTSGTTPFKGCPFVPPLQAAAVV